MRIPEPLIPLFEPIRRELQRVEILIHKNLAKVDEPLWSVLGRLLAGGKRIRPALVIVAAKVFAPTTPPVLGLAAAVEMLHTATLIHDDLIDEGPMRRNRKTLNTVWPAGATVLAGDYLLSEGLTLIAGLDHPRIVGVMADAVATICAGEVRQMFVTKGKHSHRQTYYRSIDAKTAVLFAAAAEAAALLERAPAKQVAALSRFGRNLGMAFQITDDVLDLTGDETELGKPVGSDLRQGLVTLPTLYYLEQAGAETPVRQVLSGERDEAVVGAALRAIRTSGVIETALDAARKFSGRSRQALTLLPDNRARRLLSQLADYVVDRRH